MTSETTPPAIPDISVIVPVHNVGPWVEDCLTSILSDQEVAHEVIVIDDASTDDTWEIVENIAARDPRVRTLHNPGAGGAEARNHGVKLARGTYIAFADGDDLVPRQSYSAMLAAARDGDADMVVAGFLKFYTTRTWHPTANWPAWDEYRHEVTLAEQPSLIRNRACWNRLYRKDFWTGEGILFPTVPRSNDVVPMTRALVAARRISIVPRTVYLYRNRPGGTSMSARAAGAIGFASYLTQELESGRLITSVGDNELDCEYQKLVLLRDGRIHLENFLKGLSQDDVATDGLAELSKLIDQLLSRFPIDVIAALDPLNRWTWSLARTGRWSEVIRLVNAPVRVLVTGDVLKFPTAACDEDAPVDVTDHRRTLTSALLRIASSNEVDDTIPALLIGNSDLFQRLYPSGMLHWQPAAVQEIVLAIRTGDEATVGSVLAGPSLNVTDVQLTVRGREAYVSASIRSVKPVTDVTANFTQGARRYTFERADIDPHTGQFTAAVPLRTLPSGTAFLRLRFRHALGYVDVIVTPSVARDAVSHRIFQIRGNRQMVLDPGPLQRVKAFPRRAARAALRSVRTSRLAQAEKPPEIADTVSPVEGIGRSGRNTTEV